MAISSQFQILKKETTLINVVTVLEHNTKAVYYTFYKIMHRCFLLLHTLDSTAGDAYGKPFDICI